MSDEEQKKSRQARENVTGGGVKITCKKKGLSGRQREVLEVLAKSDDVCANKDIAAVTSLDPKQISCQLTALKKKGFVASPVRCKYKITEAGKAAF